PLHQLSQRAARFILQESRRQLELNLLMQIFNDLSFLGAFGIMLFRVFDVVLDYVSQIDKRFPWNQLGRKRVIDRRQDLLLNLTQRDSVVRLFARQFFHWKIVWEMDNHEARFAGLLSNQLLTKFR